MYASELNGSMIDYKEKGILSLISKIREEANAFITQELKAVGASDLQPCHGSILGVLYFNSGNVQMKDLPEKLNRSKSTITGMVDYLEKQGYVIRVSCPKDGRCSYVELTTKGEGFREAFLEISTRLNDRIWSGFSKEETMIVSLLLKKMLGNLG